MRSSSPWSSFYEILPDGRACMSVPQGIQLEIKDSQRILETDIAGEWAKVLLLDRPFRLGERIRKSNRDAYHLHPIALRELPGWPPMLEASESAPARPAPMTCCLISVRFEPDPDRLEFDLDYVGSPCKARLSGCPAPLLRCAVATLNLGAIDNRLSTLQDAQLIGYD